MDVRNDAMLDDGRDRGATPVGVDDVGSEARAREDHDDLLGAGDDAGFGDRWEDLQAGFVDDPRRTVEQADELVAQVMERIAEGFSAERARLEEQWDRGEDVSTEDLRIAVQRYRAFFRRLLCA
jgi:hypothetical protein